VFVVSLIFIFSGGFVVGGRLRRAVRRHIHGRINRRVQVGTIQHNVIRHLAGKHAALNNRVKVSCSQV